MDAPTYDRDAAAALGRLVEQVISVPSMRREFRNNPREVAIAAGIQPDDKVQRLIDTLASLSASELALLSELNTTLINEGLYVETGNPPLMVF
jgi:hypothetical protein